MELNPEQSWKKISEAAEDLEQGWRGTFQQEKKHKHKLRATIEGFWSNHMVWNNPVNVQKKKLQ